MDDRPRSFGEHLEELRLRLVISSVAVVVAALVGFSVSGRLMSLLTAPLLRVLKENGLPATLQYLSLGENFISHIQISLAFGFLLALPVVAWQIWKFVAVGLLPEEQKWVRLLFPAIFASFLGGVLFFYFLFFPVAIDFFIRFGMTDRGTAYIVPNIRVSELVSFFTEMSLILGAVFEIPLVMLFLDRIGVVKIRSLANYRKHIILGAFIIGAILTPTPDMVTQGLMSGALILLFEMGMLLIRCCGRRPDTGSSATAGVRIS